MISLKKINGEVINKIKKAVLVFGIFGITMTGCGKEEVSVKPEEPTTEKDKTGTTEMNKEFNYLPATEMTSAETETYIADLIKDPENLGSKQIEKKDIKAIPDEETLEDNGLTLIYWYKASLVETGATKSFVDSYSGTPREEYHYTSPFKGEVDGKYIEYDKADYDLVFHSIEIVPIVKYRYDDESAVWEKIIVDPEFRGEKDSIHLSNASPVLNTETITKLDSLSKQLGDVTSITVEQLNESKKQKTLSR